MDIGNILTQAGHAAGKGTVKQIFAKGNGSDESISNNKVGAVVGGIGAIAALSALGIAATPVVGVALCAGAVVGAKGESSTKKTAKVAGNVLIGTAALTGVVGLGAVKLAGGALGVATSGVRGGVSGLLGHFKGEHQYLAEGLAYLDKQEYLEALSALNAAEAKNKNDPKIYLIRGTTFELLSKLTEAIQDYSKAIEIDSDLIEAYSSRGSLNLALGELDKAIGDFSACIIRDEKDAGSYFNRAKAYVALEDYINAITDYDSVISLRSDHVEALFLRGCLLTQIGDYRGAISDFTTFIGLRPQDSSAHYQRAKVLCLVKDYKNAVKDFNILLEITSGEEDISELYFQRATCFQQLKAYKAAISDYSEVISRNPDNIKAYFNRGSLYPQIGNIHQGEIDLHRVLELDSKHAGANIRLGYLSASKSRFKEAVIFFESAIKSLYQESRLSEIPKIQSKIKELKKLEEDSHWWNKKLF